MRYTSEELVSCRINDPSDLFYRHLYVWSTKNDELCIFRTSHRRNRERKVRNSTHINNFLCPSYTIDGVDQFTATDFQRQYLPEFISKPAIQRVSICSMQLSMHLVYQ